MYRPISVAVLMGGTSSEREVSLRTGAAVARALASRGHRVLPVDVRSETGDELDGLPIEACFIALHGRFGEDGTLQALLDRRRLPYTGSGPRASRLAMDKLEAKALFEKARLATPADRVIVRGDSIDVVERAAEALGLPVVIKPRAEGSSVGVSLHRERATLFDGAIEAWRHGPTALMEKFAAGREMTVGILDGAALPPVELRPKRAFLDYDAKYADPDTEYLVDPPLLVEDRRRIQEAALAAHRALGCEGATRVDLIFTAARQAVVLEVNTIPGMTERSLLPKAAAAAGVDYPELCERILRGALKRRRGLGGWVAAAML